MRYSLAEMVRRTRKTRRKSITLRPITAPATMASDLFASSYSPIVKAWEAALPDILAAYERALSAMTRDSPAEVGAVMQVTENDLTRLVLSIRLRLERWAGRLEAYQRSKWRGAVLTATGIDVSTMIGPADQRMTMAAAVERNVGLVRSVSEQTRQRIGEAVFRGLQKRAPAAEVAKEIREATGMARRRALRVAADQTVKLASALNEERRREAGISTWEWLASGKTNYRPEHKARNGKRYDDDATSGVNKPPAERPGELPWCGCTSRAVLSLDDEY